MASVAGQWTSESGWKRRSEQLQPNSLTCCVLCSQQCGQQCGLKAPNRLPAHPPTHLCSLKESGPCRSGASPPTQP